MRILETGACAAPRWDSEALTGPPELLLPSKFTLPSPPLSLPSITGIVEAKTRTMNPLPECVQAPAMNKHPIAWRVCDRLFTLFRNL